LLKRGNAPWRVLSSDINHQFLVPLKARRLRKRHCDHGHGNSIQGRSGSRGHGSVLRGQHCETRQMTDSGLIRDARLPDAARDGPRSMALSWSVATLGQASFRPMIELSLCPLTSTWLTSAPSLGCPSPLLGQLILLRRRALDRHRAIGLSVLITGPLLVATRGPLRAHVRT
jgi:hypothetical protein